MAAKEENSFYVWNYSYIGKKQAAPILLRGLEKLEYRGYDSAGIAVRENSAPDAKINIVKAKGRLKALLEKTDCGRAVPGLCGIGHTRWATHGEPSELNAHPHCTDDLSVVLVHNGIIENYQEIREKLTKSGYRFYSQTDTEAAVKLIDSYYKQSGEPLTAISQAMLRIRGSYAFAMMFRDFPRQPLCRPQGQPAHHRPERGRLLHRLGRAGHPGQHPHRLLHRQPGDGAADGRRRPLLQHRPRGDRKGAGADSVGRRIGREGAATPTSCSRNPRAAAGGARHHPELFKTSRGRLIFPPPGWTNAFLKQLERIYFVACGSAYHVGAAAKYVIEAMTDLPVEIDLASEFRYRDPKLVKNSLVVVVSQSGETADSLAALRLAKDKGVPVLGIVNVVGSSIARESDYLLYTYAGPEISVATTRPTAPSWRRSICSPPSLPRCAAASMSSVAAPSSASCRPCRKRFQRVLEDKERIQWFASKYANAHDIFFIGRGLDYAISLEGSLKMKEISYIHSEAYAAGELKHGTISLVEDGTLVIGVATQQGAV